MVSGISSRTPVEAIFDAGVGQVSCARSTGTYIGEGILGSVEYATAIDGAKLIVVMGHCRNEAVRRAIELRAGSGSASAHGSRVDEILQEIGKSVGDQLAADWPTLGAEERWRRVDDVSRAHVARTATRFVTESPTIAAQIEAGTVKIIGALYDVENGRVDYFSSPGEGADLVVASKPRNVMTASASGPR